jgi:hypothetical protein
MAKSKAAKAGAAASAARSNPYVRRALEDEDLRDNVWVAFEAARDAYGRVSNGKRPAKMLTDDKKVQKDIKKASGELQHTSKELQAATAALERSQQELSLARDHLAQVQAEAREVVGAALG